MELFYLSMLTDKERCEFCVIDTLIHPLDFIESVEETCLLHEEAAAQHALIHIEAFAFAGTEEEIAEIERIGCSTIQDTFVRKLSSDASHLASPAFEDLLASQFFEYYLRGLYNDSNPLFPLIIPIGYEDNFHLLAFSFCPSIADAKNYQYAIALNLQDWVDGQQVHLLGKQLLTRSFLLNSLRGRRIIVPLYDNESKSWELLIEGARKVPLTEKPFVVDRKCSDVWAEASIESILLNPAYAYGVCFEPWELLEDWSLALWYLISVTSLENNWSIPEIVSLYDRYIDKMKQRLPYIEAEEIVSKELAIGALSKTVVDIERLVKGDTSYSEREYLSRMKYRQYHLSKLAYLIDEVRPGCLERAQLPRAFESAKFEKLLHLCNYGNNYERGVALENLAEYFFGTIPGWKAVGKRVKSFNGEIDLAFCNTSLNPVKWNMGAILMVECKNQKKAAGISVVRNFYYMMHSKGCTAGAIFSMQGFTQVAEEEASLLALKDCTMLLISGDDLSIVSDTTTPEALLNAKYYELRNKIENDTRMLGY